MTRNYDRSRGFRTLLRKEIARFFRVPGQTLLSPLITTVLYFIVFGFTVNIRAVGVPGESYARFIVPGLIMLGVVSNTFLNTTSSLFTMKLQGTIVDLLVTPLTYGEILAAFVSAAVLRGFLVGGAMWIVAGLFTTFDVAHPALALAFIFLVGCFFAASGLVAAIWAEKFEQVNLVPTFIITPLTFLGGVFYSVNRLPGVLRHIARVNPILYMVDGLRFGILGHSDVSPWVGVSMLLVLNAVALSAAWWCLKSGYKLRS
jgi:ABC-2 type transport system permease protein